VSEKAPTTATSAAPNTEDLLKAALATIEQQKGKLADMETAMRKAQAAAARTAKAEKNAPKTPTEPPPAPESHTHEHEDHSGTEQGTGHLMHQWQHYCTGPNCEGENPNFKDETQCDPEKGGCGMHLGSVEVAQKLYRCPSCGGRFIRKLKK
jgi:hypothetical protein